MQHFRDGWIQRPHKTWCNQVHEGQEWTVCLHFSDEHKKHVEEEKKKMKQEQQHAMTQEEKMSCCAPAQVKGAREARTLCHNVDPQTAENCKAIMQGDMTKNCPTTVKDTEMAEDTFRPDVLEHRQEHNMLQVKIDVCHSPE